MSRIFDAVLSFFGGLLTFLHNLVAAVPFLESAAWGWAIVLLTLVVRVALLPLAIKQTRSMRAMTALQPQLRELQKKYKVDRELMRKDPDTYRAKRQKLNEEMMALYKREGVNPAASCLPLLAQAPIFIALFWTLREYQRIPGLEGAEFYFFTSIGEGGLEMLASAAGWPGWLLILLMSGTMFFAQKQMMARNASQMADNPMAAQQKILLYVMPVFLAAISWQFPVGILLYWVTTNIWQVAQQWIILREVRQEVESGELTQRPGGDVGKRDPKSGPKSKGDGSGSGDAARPRSPGASSGAGPSKGKKGGSSPKGGGKGSGPSSNGQAGGSGKQQGARDHLPRRRGGTTGPGGQQ